MTSEQADRIIQLLNEIADEILEIRKESNRDYNDDVWRGVMDGLKKE